MHQFVEWYMNDALWFSLVNITCIGFIGFVVAFLFNIWIN